MNSSEGTSGREIKGFPWLSALVIYTISWGWSLINPNSLYWDDWAYIFNQPKSYLSEIFSKTGLAPWRALIDQELIGIGFWTIRWMTFVMFFLVGVFLFEILKEIPFVSPTQNQSIVLLFLIIPLNHARISLTMFGYTTSYFLFFLAWMVLVKYSSWAAFLSASLFFMWSFMTHSFLIFSVLPILHFVFLRREQLLLKKPNPSNLFRLGVLLGSPMLYYLLRTMFWSPDPEYLWYHTIYLRAVLVSTVYFLPFIVLVVGVILWTRHSRKISPEVLMITSGCLAFGVGVFPYISSGNLDSRATFFFWELGWTSRHQLLMPLGVSVIGVSLVCLFLESKLRLILGLVSAVMISLNVFWGIGSYIDSSKKDRLVELFALELANNESSSFVVTDETQYLNFRSDSYRRYELAGLLFKAGKVPTPRVEDECGDESNLTEIIIESDKGLFEAFFSRDLGLSLKVQPCKSS